jgi:Ni/Fe-hydrogenase 1 B-type cytochrome subunit
MTSAAPTTSRAAQAPTGLERVYVWELPVRLTHWLIALSLFTLACTGYYIGRPFIIVSGEAGHHFVMGWMRAIHFYAAIVFVLSVLSRIVWMFVGNEHARWNRFLPVTASRWRGFWHMFSFYSFLRSDPPPIVGHNALAGAAYSVVFLLYLVMIATGLGLYAAIAPVDSFWRVFESFTALFGGLQSTRWIHHIVMWLLLGFLAHHLGSAMLVTIYERTGTVESIFSGYKFVPKSWRKARREAREE